MTKCEKMHEKMDYCVKNARYYQAKGDKDMRDFWISAMEGYMKKLRVMSVEECGQEADE